MAYIIEDSGARVVFSDARFEATAREAGAARVLLAGEELDAALASASDEPMPLDGPAGGIMIYTSGTSGRPKGVKRKRAASLGQALATQDAAAASFGLDGAGPHLVTGPLYHAGPLLFAVYDQGNGAPMRDHAALGRGASAGADPGARGRPHAPGADDVRAPAAPARRRSRALPRSCAAAWCCTEPPRSRRRSSAA